MPLPAFGVIYLLACEIEFRIDELMIKSSNDNNLE